MASLNFIKKKPWDILKQDNGVWRPNSVTPLYIVSLQYSFIGLFITNGSFRLFSEHNSCVQLLEDSL